jgi:phosphoglucomutase
VRHDPFDVAVEQCPDDGGRAPDPRTRIDVDDLLGRYYDEVPDPRVAEQRVAFGTSGHRGTSLRTSFNERHILATTEAICRERAPRASTGPLFLGRDTHALSAPAIRTALEVLAAHGVEVRVDDADGYTPTPVISHAILTHNRDHPGRPADGIVVTPSHNPPEDGGFKYNPPHGGPADADGHRRIEDEANACWPRVEIRGSRGSGPPRRPPRLPPATSTTCRGGRPRRDRGRGLSLGADPLGGATVDYWGAIGERFGLDLEVVNPTGRPTFAFMPPDHDGRTRMDCSSSAAMAGWSRSRPVRRRVRQRPRRRPARHRHPGQRGCSNPNHYLAVAIELPVRRPGLARRGGRQDAGELQPDRPGRARPRRRLLEVPVGFKWFVPGCSTGRIGFGGEESAGASFLRTTAPCGPPTRTASSPVSCWPRR